jgi:hypothetical protein
MPAAFGRAQYDQRGDTRMPQKPDRQPWSDDIPWQKHRQSSNVRIRTPEAMHFADRPAIARGVAGARATNARSAANAALM